MKSRGSLIDALGSGIQRVLASDQASDNESYRMCVESLSAMFLPKVQREPMSRHAKTLALANQYDANIREKASAFHLRRLRRGQLSVKGWNCGWSS